MQELSRFALGLRPTLAEDYYIVDKVLLMHTKMTLMT